MAACRGTMPIGVDGIGDIIIEMVVGQLAGPRDDIARQHNAQLIVPHIVIAVAPGPLEMDDRVLGQHAKRIEKAQAQADGSHADEKIDRPRLAEPYGAIDRDDKQADSGKCQQVESRPDDIDYGNDRGHEQKQSREPTCPLHRHSNSPNEPRVGANRIILPQTIIIALSLPRDKAALRPASYRARTILNPIPAS